MPNNNTLTELANSGVDKINAQVAAHVFAATAMENIYQGEIEKGGRGSTSEFSDNTTGSSISVVRPLPVDIEPRELGAAINGGNFSAVSHQPKSDSYELKIITVIDDFVDIPGIALDMIPVALAQKYVKNISDVVTLHINAVKLASAVYTSFGAEAVEAGSTYIQKMGVGDKMLDKLTRTYIALDKGDKKNGVAMFPQDDRIGLLTVDSYAEILSANGVFQLGGANYAYDMIQSGTVSQGANQRKLNDGYVGTMYGIPFHTVAPLVLSTACKYLGFPEEELDGVLAIVKSAHGNLFALATGSEITTIQCPIGPGIRLLPKYRMGAACIMPKANSFLVGADFENPFGIKNILTSNTIAWSYRAPGSRAKLDLNVTAQASHKFTVVKGDLVEGAWVVGDVKTVGAFVKAYNAEGAVKGAVTFDASTTLDGVSTGNKVTFVCVDRDGTVALKTVAAL